MELFIIIWILSGIACAFIAQSKGYSAGAWFFGGLIFGIFALIAIGLSEKKGQPAVEVPKQPDIPVWKRPFQLPAEKKCPRCAEMIKFEAKVCRYCQHEFNDVEAETKRLEHEYTILVTQKKAEQRRAEEERLRRSVIANKQWKRNAIIIVGIVLAALVYTIIMVQHNKTDTNVASVVPRENATSSLQVPVVVVPKEASKPRQNEPRSQHPINRTEEVTAPVKHVRRWFVRIKYPSGSTPLFELDEEFTLDHHVVGDTVRPVPFGYSDRYNLEPPGKGDIRGVIVAKFDSLVEAK